MRKLTIEQIKEKLQEINPNLIIDEATFVKPGVKCRFFEKNYGEFWCKPAYILNGSQKGHPKASLDKRKQTCLDKYGVEHPQQAKEVRDKVVQTNINKYGTLSPAENKEIQNKTKKTNLKKYGVEYTLQSKNIRKKIKNTNIDKYGVEYPNQNPEVREKTVQTNLDRYGVASTLQVDEVKAKIAKTNIERYGVENPFSSEVFQAKARETMLKKYGETNPQHIPELRAKILESFSKREGSVGERELSNWLTSQGFQVIKKFTGGSNPVELDIVIEDKRLAIEYNGDYWHSEANKNITKGYHLKKTLSAKSQGLNLIHIFEHEWKSKKDICKDFLLARLGKSQKIYARKCELKEVSIGEANSFFEKYHLQGKAKLIKAYGLYYQNDLITCIGFSKPHRQNMSNLIHLSRLASKTGFSVSGGLSRLCSHAHKELGDFISFVHLRLSNGDSYLKAGFKLVDTLPPDYWYFDSRNRKIVSKQARKKGRVNTPEGMTEHEHALSDGLYRVYDCGKLKFLYNNKMD